MEPPIPNFTTDSTTKSPFFTERARQLRRRPSPPPSPPSPSYRRVIIDYLHLDAIAGVAGVAISYKAMKLWYSQLKFTCSALSKVRHAPNIPISDLRSFLNHLEDDGKIVFIRGFVQPSPHWIRTLLSTSNPSFGLVESVDASGKVIKGVLKTQAFGNVEHDKGWFGWIPSLKYDGAGVDFGLADSDRTKLYTNYVNYVDVKMDIMDGPKVLTEPLYIGSVGDFLNPSGKLLGEAILPVGKEVTAVGRIFHGEKGVKPYIEACSDIPYFVSHMTKEQIVDDLDTDKVFLILGGIVFGSLSIWVLAHVFRRYWRKHKSSS